MMSREDVFKATGPTSGSSMTVKIGVKQGRQDHRRRRPLQVPGRRLPRLAGDERLPVRLRALRHRERARGRLRRGVQPAEGRRPIARRARRSRAFAVESVLDMLAQEDRHGPAGAAAEERRRARARTMIYGPKLAHDGYAETIEALLNHPAYKAPLGQEPGARRRLRLLVQRRRRIRARPCRSTTTAPCVVATGSPDIGGSRASMAMMAAETLGVDYNQVRAIVADTASVGYTHVTGGSRVTFATGMAVVDATKKVIEELCARAAMIWDVDAGGRGLGGRLRQAGEQQCRRFRAAVAEGDRRPSAARPAGRSSPRRRSTPAARRPASPPSSATSRSIPRPAR